MQDSSTFLTAHPRSDGGLDLIASSGAAVATIATPVAIDALLDPADPGSVQRIRRVYDEIHIDGDGLTGTAELRVGGRTLSWTDRWTGATGGSAVVDRVVVVAGGEGTLGFRTRIDVAFTTGEDFDDLHLFAPPALYDLNDIDGDGLEDYLDTRDLSFRDDRLTALAVLACSPRSKVSLALTRDDPPEFDDVPVRDTGQTVILQATDVGSLGMRPDEAASVVLSAAYPFDEGTRSHALTSEGREPWEAFWPVGAETATLETRYGVRLIPDGRPIDALWSLWTQRIAELAPRRVELTDTLEEITRLRVEALLPYYGERPGETPLPAGYVTNCHPQDGVQLGNIIQYGFTGQNVLNALHVLNHAAELSDPEAAGNAHRVIEFFVAQAGRSPHGLTSTLYDLDSGRSANWWSGLILPLAYADEGDDLEALMGPVYKHMSYAIEPLRGLDGTYLRCMAEEHTALLRAYQSELERGAEHSTWLAVLRSFGEFLLAAQEADGSWRRAYGFDGGPITEPRSWFGIAELNQKSSTATAIPLLVGLHRLTGDDRWLESAIRAERFVAEHFIHGMKHNGGVHDSIYSRAQLVDSESILFAMRAALHLWRLTGDQRVLDDAIAASRLLATWIYLWDVPLPPASTLAGWGFRSTGWSACDTCGAGYIHPYEIHAAPDLFEVALASGDGALALLADLVLHGSSETVSTPTRDWGYASPGLQEEGLLVSWWLIDDPMFVGTHFGGRGKGEGNKTCLPWISAVGIDAVDELIRRFGTVDLPDYWRMHRSAGLGSSRRFSPGL
jgi:hypothetical protein